MIQRIIKFTTWTLFVLLTFQPAGITPGVVGAAASSTVTTITTGMHIVPTWHYGREIKLVNDITGNKIGVVLIYTNWRHSVVNFLDWLFDSITLDSIHPAVPPTVLLAWEPTDGTTKPDSGPGCDNNYSGFVGYDTILGGHCDAYIRAFAQQLKARSPQRFLLKFAHEMNITSRPWWPGYIGSSAQPYVNMYRYVHNIFASENVTNVEWLWAPVAVYDPPVDWNKTSNYYPGDDVVDWVGPMNYNYDGQYSPPFPWQSFTTLFDSALREFSCNYRKPQIIHEMGSVQDDGAGHTKASWITDAFARAPTYPFLRAIVWLNTVDNLNPAADFRITTSTNPPDAIDSTPPNVNPLPIGSGAWTTSYANAVQPSTFTNTLPTLAQATPSSTTCSFKNFIPIILK